MRAQSVAKAVLVVALLVLAVAAGREGAVLTRSTAQAATAQAAPPPTSTSVAHHSSPSVRGEITAIKGDTWSLTATDGSKITVTLTAQTVFGTGQAPADRAQFTVGTTVAITGPRGADTVTANRIIMPIARPSATPTPPPSTTPTPMSTPPAPTTCAASAGLNHAVAYADARGEQAAVAVYDTETGAHSSAGDADAEYSSASVMKVFVAADLLLTNQMTGNTESTAYQMITASDDDATDTLYGLVGGDAVITTIADHYGITNLGSPPADTGQWGETKITADGLVHLYAKLKADPAVWPWLSNAMSNTTRDGTDGTDQFFGIPSASQDWSVKQGWMTGLGPGSNYNSTGYVDGNRYAVAILTYGSVSQYGQHMSDTLTQAAKDVLPDGVPGGLSAPCP